MTPPTRIRSTPRHEDAILAELSQRDLYEELFKIANAYGVSPREIVGRSRLGIICQARHAWWAHLHSKGHWSNARIALLHGYETSSVNLGVHAHNGVLKKRP